jgi:hypothetical protein
VIIRRFFLSTTMLSGVVGAAFLSAPAAVAADYSSLRASPIAPAVDGLNSKIEGYGGSIANRSLYGGDGGHRHTVGRAVGSAN